jgi:hypothetical protein
VAAEVFGLFGARRISYRMLRKQWRTWPVLDRDERSSDGWLLATQARLGMTGETRAALAALNEQQAGSGEVRNARAVICLAEGDPAAAVEALDDVFDRTAPVVGYVTVVEAHLLAGFAYHELGDRRAANQATERALGMWCKMALRVGVSTWMSDDFRVG